MVSWQVRTTASPAFASDLPHNPEEATPSVLLSSLPLFLL